MDARDLLNACKRGNLKTVMQCAEEGVDLEARDNHGMTPVMVASHRGHRDIVEYLTGRKVDLNARDNDGWTPIMWASWNGREDIVECLAGKGIVENTRGTRSVCVENTQETSFLCDLGARNNRGETALFIALRTGYTSIAKHLALCTIPNPDVPYSDVLVSCFVPRYRWMPGSDYTEFARKLVPMYLERSVKDPAFGISMQQNIEEILGGKTDEYRESLTEDDKSLLSKIRKTLRSIDYTEFQVAKAGEEVASGYDMEL